MTPLLTYLWALLGLSLIAIGGASAVLPELHGLTVTQQHWLTSREFSQLFAIAQAAPGPNVLIVAVIGWKLAGIGGALLSVVAMCGPSSVVAYVVSRAWSRFERARWRIVLASVLAPLAVGLVSGGGFVIATTIGPSWIGVALVAVAALVGWRTKISPIAIFAFGACVGATGLV